MEVDGKRLDDDIVSELCEPCQEGNVSTQADGYCNDCEEYMCQTCFQSHVKMKLGRNHVLGAVDAGRKQGTQSQAEKCKKHTSETIKYYCRSHDTVGCGDCIVSYHGKCKPEFIRNLAKNFEESTDFKNIVKEVDDLDKLKAEIEVSLEKYRKENTEYHDKAIHEIQQNRAEITTWLENVTSKVEEEEMEIWKENEIVLSKLEDWVKIISDMVDKAREDKSNEKYKGENLFTRVIECRSKISDFATKSVPEIKSNFCIKSFTFEPNKQLFVLKKSTNLGVIRVGNRSEEVQTSQAEQQNNMTLNDGATNVASSKLQGPEAEGVVDGGSGTLKRSEDHMRVELEKELERIPETTILEKEQRENLEKTIVVLKQENNSVNDLNLSLKSQLHNCKQEFETLESKYKARQEQDHTKIQSLQSELKKISESHEKERKSLSSKIRDLQRQRDSAQKTYQLPDPRASGFDVGKRVQFTGSNWMLEGWTGTVTAVDPSGYVYVKWDNDKSGRFTAGAGAHYQVKLL